MGEIGQALKAVQAVKAFKDSKVQSVDPFAGSGGNQSVDPGLQQTDPMAVPQTPQMPDFSNQGMAQAGMQPQGGTANLDALFGVGSNVPDQSAPQMQAPQAPAAPVDNPYTPYDGDPTKDIAQNVGTSDSPPIEVNGDAWQPHQETKLGRIVDTILQLRGRSPVFEQRTDQANLQSAMEGNPEQSRLIHRVAQFNPDMAYKMQLENARQQMEQSSADKSKAATDVLIDKAVLPQVGGLAMAVANEKDPAKQQALWDKARQRILATGEQYHRDYSSMFPEKFDSDAISLAIGQAINPGKQESLKQGQARVDQGAARVTQGEEKITLQGKDIDSKIVRRAAETAQGATNTTIKQNRYSDMKPSVISTAHGNMEVRGNRGVLVGPDGSRHLFMTNDGHHWVHVNTLPPIGTK